MKKTQKPNLLTFILMLCAICISTLMFSTDAQAATSGEIPCSEGQVTWTLDDNGVLTFSGSGTTDIYVYNGSWLDYWTNSDLEEKDVLSVKVDENSNIKINTARSMFRNFEQCVTMDLSGFDMSQAEGMSYMFYNCKALTELDLDNFVTGNVTDMKYMFYGCNTLTELDLSGFVTGNVTDMMYMFYGCSALTKLDVSNFVTENVTDMKYMFYKCSALTELDLSGFTTENVTDMEYMFYKCSALTELDASFATGNVTDMKYMFCMCSALTELDASNFATENVTDMKQMFYECKAMTKLDLSGFTTENVTDMSFMFYECNALTELDVSSFETGKVTDMSYMFRGCGKVTELNVSGFDTGAVNNMAEMFSGCESLMVLDVSNFDTRNVTRMDSMFRECKLLTELDVSGFVTVNVGDMSLMFYRCHALTQLDVSGFETGNTTYMRRMFEDCGALMQLDVSGFETGKVTNMERMFDGCRLLTQLDVSGFETGKVKDMSYMFANCQGVTELDVTGFETGNVTNMKNMFAACLSLRILDISNFDTSNVTDTAYFIASCSSLIRFHTPTTPLTVTLPSTLITGKIWVDNEKTIYSSQENTFTKSVIVNLVNKSYNISYVTDGELIDCPTTYKVTEGIAVLGTAQANCKKFAGWYSDAQYTKPITAIEKGTFGDLTLYGKLDANHDIDRENGTIIKPATETEAGTIQYQCKNCTYTITEEIPKLSKEQDAATPDKEPETPSDSTESTIINTGEKDVKGSSFAMIQVRANKTTKNTIRLKWNKIKDADGYLVYGTKCGRKNKYQLLKNIKNNKTTSFTQKKLKKGTYYKYIVRAYKMVEGKRVNVAVSKIVHATTTGGKYGNAKSVKVNKTKVTLKKNKTFKLKASEVKKSKKIDKHRAVLFESSDTSIATVTKKGVVKGKKKGTCYIYAYAQNGVYKKIKVKVK